MSRIRGGSPRRQRVRAGAPDRSLTANAGLGRVTPGQWRAVESGLAVVTGRMLG